MKPLERGPGLDAELLEERAPRLLVGVQRVRLAPVAVEREHQLPAQALSQRMLGDQGLELAEKLGVIAELELGVDSLLDHAQPQLLELRDRGLRERVVGEARRAAARARAAPPRA